MKIEFEKTPSKWRDRKEHVTVKLSIWDVEKILRKYMRSKGVPIPDEGDLVWGHNEYFRWEFSESDIRPPDIYNLHYSFDI